MKRPDRLDSLRVITPCNVPWSSMTGDDAVRFCGQCRKNVYNVAALSRAEAVALIEQAEGRVCMQLTRRADGTIATGDCWAQLRRARSRGLVAFAVALPVILAAQLWSQAFGLRTLFAIFHRPPPCAVMSRTLGEPEPRTSGLIALPREEHQLKGKISMDAELPMRGRVALRPTGAKR
jgi:hypothetical protein